MFTELTQEGSVSTCLWYMNRRNVFIQAKVETPPYTVSTSLSPIACSELWEYVDLVERERLIGSL